MAEKANEQPSTWTTVDAFAAPSSTTSLAPRMGSLFREKAPGGTDAAVTDAELGAVRHGWLHDADFGDAVFSTHDDEGEAEVDEPLQAWEVACSSDIANDDVDYMAALFNSDPRLPFEVLHLGALLCAEPSARTDNTTTTMDSATSDVGNPFEDLRAFRSPVELRAVPGGARPREGKRRSTRLHALVAPALSPHLCRRSAVQRDEKAVDEVISARSAAALQQFVRPEVLEVLGRHRSSAIWGSQLQAKKSRTASLKRSQ